MLAYWIVFCALAGFGAACYGTKRWYDRGAPERAIVYAEEVEALRGVLTDATKKCGGAFRNRACHPSVAWPVDSPSADHKTCITCSSRYDTEGGPTGQCEDCWRLRPDFDAPFTPEFEARN